MAMHVHASFSEGTASYESHLEQASRHGVDVIWWTDHDFRVAAHQYRRAVRFDGPVEAEGELEWAWTEERSGELSAASAEYVTEPRTQDEDGSALRLTVIGGPGGGELWQRGTAFNWTYSTSLADTTLELDILPEEVATGTALVLQIESSHHPARAGRPAGQYRLEYRFGGAEQAEHRAEGLLGIVRVPVVPRRWQRTTLRPVDDIARIWPDLVAEDNSLHQLRIGVRVDEGERVRFVVDRLRFDRGRGVGPAGVRLRRDVLARYAGAYPGVAGYEAFEISLVRHLNWFGGELTLPPLPVPPYRDNDVERTIDMVEFIHRHGGLVQWNHPLDIETPESLAALMIERDNLGADLVEIGREPVENLLDVFDIAARNAVFFTGVGVTDDHEGTDWLHQKNNWLTYVWAPSTGVADLTGALRAGRAWFCDPARWRGELDVLAWGKPAMGGVAVCDDASVPMEVTATDLPAGYHLDIIVGTVDYAGLADLSPSHAAVSVPAVSGASRNPLDVAVGDGAYVRPQIRDASGALVAVGNPVWLLRTVPPRGIPDDRRITHIG
ncbi:hypothetical protein G1H10_29955 [Phytoactinopolyspora halotolerans]|uniref:Uncharacterized protein n=2 Tax=Phytoactinopolyspora halotolerans TaxID=1981512 RepID=A0A6L9SJ17_9ACTN|nr:hypothetical protein [Phytoactinopolyspora halotolerans]